MKRQLFRVIVLLSAITVAACKKEGSNMPNATLQASKTSSIKRGEPVSFTLGNVTTTATVNWRVSPSANVFVSDSGNVATILFGKAGVFTVSAICGNIRDSTVVTVGDAIFTGEGQTGYHMVPLTGDEIVISPTLVDSGAHSILLLAARTTKTYDCQNNFLLIKQGADGADHAIEFDGVYIPNGSACVGGSMRSTGMAHVYPLRPGSQSLKVTLNGIAYSGSMTMNGNTCTITWPYTSGVTFSSLVVR